MYPGRRAVDLSIGFRRRNAHAAKKRMQRNLNPRAKLRDHALAVERNDLDARVGKVVRQEGGAKAKPVVSVRNGQIDLLNANLQRIPRLRVFNVYRAIQYVASRTSLVAGKLVKYVAQTLLHLVGSNPGLLQSSRTVGQQRLKHHSVPRADVQHRLGCSIIVAPRHGGRSSFQRVTMRSAGSGVRLGLRLDHYQRKQTDQNEIAHVPPRKSVRVLIQTTPGL